MPNRGFVYFVLGLKLAALGFVVSAINAYATPQVNLKGTNKVERHVHLDLTKKNVAELSGVVTLDKMEQLADWLDGKPEAHLVINSPGGSVAAGLHFINKVESLRAQGELVSLQCYIQDMAASMAAIISSYCDGVLIHKFGFFMIHPASYGCEGSQGQIRTCVKFTEEWLSQISKDVAGHLGISQTEYLAFQGEERYLVAEDTVKHGFADAVYGTIYYNAFIPKKPSGGLFGSFFGSANDFLWIVEL